MGRFPIRAALAAAARADARFLQTAVAQSRPELIPVPGRIKMALYRPDSGPAPHGRHHRDAPHLELPHPPRLHRAVAARLPHAVHEFALREQRAGGRLRAAAARRQDKASSSCASSPASARSCCSPTAAAGRSWRSIRRWPKRARPTARARTSSTECSDELAGLPPVDGIVFTDAHPGNAINLLRGHQSRRSRTRTTRPTRRRSPRSIRSIPKNGFNPNGPSNYSAGIPGPLFPGAGRAHEPADRQRARTSSTA